MSATPAPSQSFQQIIDWIKQNWLIVLLVLVILVLLFRGRRRRRIIIE